MKSVRWMSALPTPNKLQEDSGPVVLINEFKIGRASCRERV